jgi:hypothetical protein
MPPRPDVVPGDRLLLCEHAWSGDQARRHEAARHWWNVRGNITTATPDGQQVDISFLVCCTSCYLVSDGDAQRVAFRKLYEWSPGDRLHEMAATT